MPNIRPSSISPEAFAALLRLLRYSWADIHYQYDGLTSVEMTLITPEHFEEIAKLIKPEKTVIHFLEHGMTACMFMPGKVPALWPVGHAWEHNWEMVNCPECLKGKEPFPQTYQISKDGKAITCLRCKRTSYHPKDVENRYCANCNMFHEDLWPPARQWWLDHPDNHTSVLRERYGRNKPVVST